MSQARAERGFTMAELMVVIAILGILAGLSIKSFRSNPTGNDARKIAALTSTASRLAVADGPVRADVAAACGQKARTQIEFSTQSNFNLVYVYEYKEDPNPANGVCTAANQWVSVSGSYLSNKAEIYAVGTTAVTLPGQTLPTALGTGTIDRRFYPDGTADGFTVYLRNPLATNTQYRIVSMQLQPAPQVLTGW